MIVNSRWLLGAAFALSAAPGLSQAGQAGESTGNSQVSAEVKNAECTARKFETIVEVMVGGERRGRKITICGEPDQTDAEWEVTLRDAIEKLEAGAGLPPDAREAAIAAIEAEIAKLRPSSSLPTPEAQELPSPPPSVSAAPSQAPPSTSAPVPTWKGVPAGGAVAPATTPSAAAAPAAPASPMKAANKPQITIRCMMPGDRGSGGPCVTVQGDTVLTVTADEELARGTSLIFVRRGTARAEAALGQMRNGQTLRLKLPPDVCRGVLRDRLEIQVRTAGAVADSIGPFPLRC